MPQLHVAKDGDNITIIVLHFRAHTHTTTRESTKISWTPPVQPNLVNP